MNWDRLIAFVTLLVDVGILWILVKEFNYDKILAEKQHYKKKMKAKPTFEMLTQGESR